MMMMCPIAAGAVKESVNSIHFRLEVCSDECGETVGFTSIDKTSVQQCPFCDIVAYFDISVESNKLRVK